MLYDFLKYLVDYSITIIPTFLIALFISAALSEILPEKFFEKTLSKKGFMFILISSIIGALIPLCTCGMIPLASKLHKKGASWLIVISFLTSGNASSITALLITLVLGLKITLVRFFFAVVFGILVAYIFVLLFRPQSFLNTSLNNDLENDHKNSKVQRIKKEFLGLLNSFFPWVFTAILIAAVIGLFIKPAYVINFAGFKNFLSPFLIILTGFPFYFCAGTEIPISKALLEKGASLGSILSFMTACGGVNLTSLLIYQKWLGLRNSLVYLAICFLICGAMGLAINFMLLPLVPYEMR